MWLWFQSVIYWPGCLNFYTNITIHTKRMRCVFFVCSFELVNCQVFTIIMTLKILWQKQTMMMMAKSVVGRKKNKHKLQHTMQKKSKTTVLYVIIKRISEWFVSEKWINGLLRSCQRMCQFEWQWCFEPF